MATTGWTIKRIGTRERAVATAAARRAGKTIGEWLAEAIMAYAGQPDLKGVASLLTAVRGAGLPVERRVADELNALLYERLGGRDA